MMQRARRIGFGSFRHTSHRHSGHRRLCGSAPAADSFEVASIKAVKPTPWRRPTPVKKGDVAKAKEAFEDYDSAWNGVEVYINTRSKSDVRRRSSSIRRTAITKRS